MPHLIVLDDKVLLNEVNLEIQPIDVDVQTSKGDEELEVVGLGVLIEHWKTHRPLKEIINSTALIELGRSSIEAELLELRDSRISMLRNNGLVVKEKDGSHSSIIRLGPEDALTIGLTAIDKFIKEY